MTATPERALVARGNRTISDPLVEREMLKRLILKGGVPSEEMMNLFIGICDRYDFDPMLKHVAIISNNIYVTRDGLLHKAHTSGQLDGIEVELRFIGEEWAATCTVYRKDMGRPIRYTALMSDHRPENAKTDSAWGKYPRAMLQKCAEVMALRRAFDISLGAIEEQGYEESAFPGAYGVGDAAPPAPAAIEAEVIRGAPVAMEAGRFAGIVHALHRAAADGIASDKIQASLNRHREHLSAQQRRTLRDLWDTILAKRANGEPWPDPDAQADGVLDESSDPDIDGPFAAGQPASIAG